MKIAIIQPNEKAYSETFIAAHKNLSPKTMVLSGGWFPTRVAGGKSLLPQWLVKINRLVAALGGLDPEGLDKKVLNYRPFLIRNYLLANFFIKKKVTIVLAEYGPTGVAVADACQKAKVPFIVHFHGFDAYQTKALKSFAGGYPGMASKSLAVIVPSEHMKEQLERLGIPGNKIVVNRYGVDPHRFYRTEQLVTSPVILFIGRFVEKKCPEILIEAFKIVLKKMPKAKMLMAGDGLLLPICKKLARDSGTSANISFLGPIPHKKIAQLMRSARVFVLPSATATNGDREGTPVVLLEAQMCGLPVVTTHHSGIGEVVLDGETGILVEEKNPLALAKAILLILTDDALAKSMGNKATAWAKKSFTLSKSLTGIKRIIKRND